MPKPDQNFRPIPGASKKVSVAATSAAVALPGSTPGSSEMTYRFSLGGATDVFFQFGISSTEVLADGTALHLPAGNTEILDAPEGATHIATIGAAGGTADLYVTRGQGS